jgi:sulfate/thiosulfate transport system permease protein
VLPLAAVVERGLSDGLTAFREEITRPVAWDALLLTLGMAALMTIVNVVMGTLTAYVLVRYEFPGRRFFDRMIDMPFAIPTLVTGVMLVALYGPQGPAGSWLQARGISIIFARPGILLALLFVCYPFVIRTVQPVLLEAERGPEEAAATLGATRAVAFRRVLLPTILPAILTGALLSFGRALGEFGSIVVVAGNIPHKTLTAPVYVFGEIESQNERGASAVSLVLLTLSFFLLLVLDVFERRRLKQHG